MNIEELTQQAIEAPGHYRCKLIAWTVEDLGKEATETKEATHTVMVKLLHSVQQIWVKEEKDPINGKVETEAAWSGEWPVGYYVESAHFIIGRNGEVNQKTADRLKECGIWFGDFDDFEGPPPEVVCIVTAEEKVNGAHTSVEGSWVNPDAERPKEPGAPNYAPKDKEALSSLRARFGKKFKKPTDGKPKTASVPPPPGGSDDKEGEAPLADEDFPDNK